MRRRDLERTGVRVAIVSVIIGIIAIAVPMAYDWSSNNATVDHIYVSCSKVSDFLNFSIIEFGVHNPSSHFLSADWYITTTTTHGMTFADEKNFDLPTGQTAHPTFTFPVNTTIGWLVATSITFHEQFVPVTFLATYKMDLWSYTRTSVSPPSLPHLFSELPNCM